MYYDARLVAAQNLTIITGEKTVAESKSKPEKNRGDTWMGLGALMIAVSIVLPFIGINVGSAIDQGLLYGGVVVAVVGLGIRSSLRRKAKKKTQV